MLQSSLEAFTVKGGARLCSEKLTRLLLVRRGRAFRPLLTSAAFVERMLVRLLRGLRRIFCSERLTRLLVCRGRAFRLYPLRNVRPT